MPVCRRACVFIKMTAIIPTDLYTYINLILFQYDNELSHYGGIDGHGPGSMYGGHADPHRSMPPHLTSHSPPFSHSTTQNYPTNYSGSGMQNVMGSSSPADSQLKRDKDAVYGWVSPRSGIGPFSIRSSGSDPTGVMNVNCIIATKSHYWFDVMYILIYIYIERERERDICLYLT